MGSSPCRTVGCYIHCRCWASASRPFLWLGLGGESGEPPFGGKLCLHLRAHYSCHLLPRCCWPSPDRLVCLYQMLPCSSLIRSPTSLGSRACAPPPPARRTCVKQSVNGLNGSCSWMDVPNSGYHRRLSGFRVVAPDCSVHHRVASGRVLCLLSGLLLLDALSYDLVYHSLSCLFLWSATRCPFARMPQNAIVRSGVLPDAVLLVRQMLQLP